MEETSYITWAQRKSAWLKIQMTQDSRIWTLYKSGIVVESTAFGDSDLESMIVKHLVSTSDYPRIFEIYLAVKPPSSSSIPGCVIRYRERTRVDNYIGAVVVAWSIISTGVEFLSLVGAIALSQPVSLGMYVAGNLITILSMTRETLSLSITSDGTYVCYWSPGLNNYRAAELELGIQYSSLPQDTSHYIIIGANVGWYTRPIIFKIPSWPRSQILASAPFDEGYPGFYGRYPGEVIYG